MSKDHLSLPLLVSGINHYSLLYESWAHVTVTTWSCPIVNIHSWVDSNIPHTGNIWHRKNWQNLANYELFTKIFLTNIQKMYLAYALTVAYSPNFSSPIAFTCMVHQNPPRQIFPMYSIPSNSCCIQFSFITEQHTSVMVFCRHYQQDWRQLHSVVEWPSLQSDPSHKPWTMATVALRPRHSLEQHATLYTW